ncbi:PREDICTED: uncharacterized protein C6orf203 homolog [Trachymyrmex cornetzi]|uniref:Mitochondrial transcription rescue factor 1 C-terminal domain-containing protein n=1 Tax=Trachymyrmex cornetzi TaxID=471704 RepID=A0A151J9L3_9HYME|nr:PREDICTED: uncharacterized protein C6orf203 homolog [Trachymyrmex cornetzi]KYN21724.1 hypothetical protein ALC57_05926 [Trachymyrmex cornetzi]
MLSKVTVNIIRRSVCYNARTLCRLRDPLQSNLFCNGDAKPNSVQNHCHLYIAKRFKSKEKAANIKKDENEDSDEEKEKDDEKETLIGSKVVKVRISSIRLDTISKAGFGISRNKIDEAFYSSKIRINGNKVLKKSKEMKIGDEIDLILHQSMDNPGLLVVNRIVILSMDPVNDSIQMKLSVDKNLLIEDYEDSYL